MTSLALDKSQAVAVFNSMHALEKVGAQLHAKGLQPGEEIEVLESKSGRITIGVGLGVISDRLRVIETHSDRAAFATAYGLI